MRFECVEPGAYGGHAGPSQDLKGPIKVRQRKTEAFGAPQWLLYSQQKSGRVGRHSEQQQAHRSAQQQGR
eukprot:5222878-Pyramimonas_sp.AAC.1